MRVEAIIIARRYDYLTVQVAGLDYQIFNRMTVADVADHDRVQGELWKNDGETSNRWKEVDRWSFHSERVATAPFLFTVLRYRWTLMCTDVLRRWRRTTCWASNSTCCGRRTMTG